MRYGIWLPEAKLHHWQHLHSTWQKIPTLDRPKAATPSFMSSTFPHDSEMPIIDIDPPTPEAKKLWATALRLAEAFGSDEPWCLIGGLMVQLHALEHGSTARPTVDIDVLGDSRRRPSMTERMASILTKRGGQMAVPPPGDEKLGLRFDIDGEVVELLGSEGLARDPTTMGKHTTFQVPGGTQALHRAERVCVSLSGDPAVVIRRPTLLGAILIKARAVRKRRGPKLDSDRQDLVLLLTFIEDPRRLSQEEGLKKSEKKWLWKIERLLDFGDPELRRRLPEDAVARAEQAYRLLIV
jgi:hypothetical protein